MDTITTSLPQPFAGQKPAAACAASCRQGLQIVPVAGNNSRPTPAFLVYHGRGYLTPEGTVTSTPVHLTFAEADLARIFHDDHVELAELIASGQACGDHERPTPCIECAAD